MRSITIFIYLALADLRDIFLSILALVRDARAFKPFFVLVGAVRAQIVQVASVFEKKPCSATGGTA